MAEMINIEPFIVRLEMVKEVIFNKIDIRCLEAKHKGHIRAYQFTGSLHLPIKVLKDGSWHFINPDELWES